LFRSQDRARPRSIGRERSHPTTAPQAPPPHVHTVILLTHLTLTVIHQFDNITNITCHS
jgi:hypothetical protein